MIENHEILCPPSLDCPICQSKRNEENLIRISIMFGPENDLEILSKHFYHLTISHKPKRDTYHKFSLEPVKKVGRELINGLSSISSISNRKWWNLFIESGVRFFSVEQDNIDEYPTFNHHFIFYSEKDNLDSRMDIQLKYRLRKINKDLTYSFEYLGLYNLDKILKCVNMDISVKFESSPMKKLGEEIGIEIQKMKEQKPILFGKKYHTSSTKMELKVH